MYASGLSWDNVNKIILLFTILIKYDKKIVVYVLRLTDDRITNKNPLFPLCDLRDLCVNIFEEK